MKLIHLDTVCRFDYKVAQLVFEDDMDINFFNWLRNGVKKSVLLGVSDAIDEIGVPDNDDQFQKKLSATLLQENKKTGAKKQRRLGRSLKDLNQTDAA